ncbi:hypothetical protein [Microbulbifer aggregans]|uniref:hypothetical protein n=1 Tax=Microbulbifer aggregans TaxID=1769779 RepID=UPI0008594701|nr:hypothetical protein [Microbulbifer aggregans]
MTELEERKTRACELAKALLSDDSDYMDRVIEMWKIGNFIHGQVWDTEFHIFGLIESETDHLPTAKVRELCSRKWLAAADMEIAECVELYKSQVDEACNEILVKYGNA